MAELEERRTYYSNGSVETIYHVDAQGRKQGKFTAFDYENPDMVTEDLEYKDNAIWNGKLNIKEGYVKKGGYIEYKNGKIISKRDGNTIYTFHNDNSVTVEFVEKDLASSRDEFGHYHSRIYEKTLQKWNFKSEGNRIKISARINGEDCFATFENGVPADKYKMPLGISFDAGIMDQDWKNKLQNISFLNVSETFKSDDEVINHFLAHPCIIAEGTWNNGKFTGKASGQLKHKFHEGYVRDRCPTEFSAEWVEGEATAEYNLRGRIQRGLRLYDCSKNYKWHDGICDVKTSLESEEHKYTLRYGQKNGVYQIAYLGRLIEESEYKNGKLHGISKKYNEKKGWLRSETQYQDGIKHGFEKLYNSDGTVTSIEYYLNGKECTQEQYLKSEAMKTKKIDSLRKIAAKRMAKEDKLSQGKDKRVILPKKKKLAKTMEFVEERIKGKIFSR